MQHRLAAVVLLPLFCSLGGPAHAQLQVSPILIELAPGQQTTTLTVANQRAEATSVQLRAFQWDQSGGADALNPTTELAVSPPITEIGGGQTQVFRLLLRKPPSGVEASYRLLLDQLPGAPGSGGSGIQLMLRVSIPVFARPAARLDRKVDWRIVIEPGGAALVGVNRGAEHVRITNPELSQDAGPKLAVQQGPSPYILPGAERHWPIRDSARLRAGSTAHLTATSDKGPVDAKVDVSRP